MCGFNPSLNEMGQHPTPTIDGMGLIAESVAQFKFKNVLLVITKNCLVMASTNSFGNSMRVIHRYLGFFLAGIMAVYALSGVLLIFRDTDFLKQEKQITQTIKPNATAEEIGKMLKMREFKVDKEEGDLVYFKNGTYNKSTGEATFTVKELPRLLDKMTHLHKAKTEDPLYFFNIFFGLSLLFFVVSAFWMFMPSTSIFRKGLYFTLGGIVLTLILLFA
jgi:hypothetical protein